MVTGLQTARTARLVPGLHVVAVTLTVLLPWLLLHTQAGTEASIDVISLCFLGRCVVERQWAWVRQSWVPFACAWWGWLILCTILNLGAAGWGGLAQACVMVRFLLFAAALTHWVLREPQARRWLWYSLAGATLYLVAQVATQLVTGHNWYGAPVSEDGEITGPFAKPRAGPSYVRMVFPVLVPTGFALLSAAGWGRRAAGLALFAGGLAVSVLIGQRMPLLLLVFGLLIMALLLPRLRLAVGVALVAGAGVLAATVVVAPRAFYRLVIKFSNQMADFPDSPYGQLAGRSIAIARQHLWTGRGYDGFRSGCALPRYFQAWHWPAALGGQSPVGGDGGGATMCATHPHNWYMQAVTDAGLPGLLLFIALAGAWLYGLSVAGLRVGLGRQPDPLRVGLFVAAFIQLWPIESTSPIISLPMGGWFFLLLGFGLAAARSP